MKEIKQEILNVSFLLRSKQSFIGEKESGGVADMNEVLEALFSLVIDLGGVEDGSVLVEKANLILGDNVQVWLNTVLQITTPLSDCATFLVPFLRHILLDRQWPQNPTLLQYIQYMLLTKQVMSMDKMEPSLAEKFRSTGLKYAAPLMFYEMVVESGAGVD
uniref:Uncharacterized protein n=1 Tax=Ciona savignyi TaxID=51511 RepID=H2Z4I8_CIOSA